MQEIHKTRPHLAGPWAVGRVIGASRFTDDMKQGLEVLLEHLFTPEHGEISFGVELGGPQWVRFRVSDSGPGIPKENLTRIFDRFWQARGTRKLGSGLGLAIARGIVKAHGGEIWAESVEGHGSQFFFTLPVALPEAA